MKQVNELLKNVLEEGSERKERTNTGALSVFGRTARFDLKKGFPAVTTKRLAWRSVLTELLWFVSGSSNNNDLKKLLHGDKDGKTIWDDNLGADYWKHKSKFEGDLGRVYGKQWRQTKQYLPSKHPNIESVINKEESDITPKMVKYKNGASEHKKYSGVDGKLFTLWKNILDSEANNEAYVSKRWMNFDYFKDDVKKIEGWWLKEAFWSEYGLTTFYHRTYTFSRYTTRWVDRNTSEMLMADPLVAYKDEHYEVGMGAKDLARNLPFTEEQITKALETGEELDGWTIRVDFIVPRYVLIDQLDLLIKSLKVKPFDRRHILSAWNVAELETMALPPCHAFAQFFVREEEGKKYLSLQLYQRSVDTFLGWPFNISSYALLLYMVAGVTGYEVDELVWVGGDTHIYSNHKEQVEEQISREPYELATLDFTPKSSIDDYTEDDFVLVNYNHHPAIKAPMAV